MKMKIITILAATAILLLGACNKLNDNLDQQLNNPNAPTPAAADVDLYLGNLELNFIGFFNCIGFLFA